MANKAIAVAAAAALLAALVFAWSGNETEAPGITESATPAADSAQTIRLLREELRRERADRLALAARVARLEEQSLEAVMHEIEAPVEARGEARGEAPSRTDSGIARSFPEAKLLEAGFGRAEVRAFRERVDGIELERLYLRDRAAREGWLDTPRYGRERREMFQSLLDTREEFGDELYDWALFASGHPNRVKVAEVMEGSPAQSAGLEAGDLLLGYGERPIFSAMELRKETLGGRSGETTAVDVVRGGETRRIFVPRGPLGIRTEMILEEPAG